MPLTELMVGLTAFAAGLSVGWIRRMFLERARQRRLSPTDMMLNRTREIRLAIGWTGVAGMLLSRLFIRRLSRDES